MELARAQDINITNLIQIMQLMKVKFLGTVKDSSMFPFHLVDVNEDGTKEQSGRLVTQMYGQRSNFTALGRINPKATDVIQASTMRQGAGKVRASRIATNTPEAMSNEWVLETTTCNASKRRPHATPPNPLPSNASFDSKAKYYFQLFESGVFIMTLFQRTQCWFLSRLFVFSSTSAHAVWNVRSAEYFNTPRLNELHRRIKQILRLNPQKNVYLENAIEHEDEHLPSQSTGLHARLQSNQVHNNCSAEWWKKRNHNRNWYIDKLDELKINHPPKTERSFQVKHACELIAEHFQKEAIQRAERLQDQDVDEHDEHANMRAAKCLMITMSKQWFKKPWQAKDGSAVEKGTANEDIVVRRLPKFLKSMSNRKFSIHGKVREYGLIANRTCTICTCSPDGAFALVQFVDGSNKLIGLCLLEIKTISGDETTIHLSQQRVDLGKFLEVSINSDDFATAVPGESRSSTCSLISSLTVV